jgi:hypothetical protein
MGPKSKKEYTAIMAKRYRKTPLDQKTSILNEYCKITGYHRKHAIRKLNHFKIYPRFKPKAGRPKEYDSPAILAPLRKIWLDANLPCGKRLKPILALWLPSYQKTYGHLPYEVIKALLKISAATIDRIFKPVRPKFKKRGHCATRSGTLLRKHIPIKTDQWDESRPGFIESDSVHHCGESTAGLYAVTVNCDDIASGWTEQRAVWGKDSLAIFYQIRDAEKSMPFDLLGFDSDNGGEFINKRLFDYFTQRPSPVQFTRSRAYHTQDNAHIEQKNYTHVRLWLGYNRFDNPQVVPLLNDLYKNEWRLFHNFFCPSVKLIEKKRVASKIIKRYDSPKTPYQRLMESRHVDTKTKEILKKQFESLNPFELRSAMETRINKILKITSIPRSPG